MTPQEEQQTLEAEWARLTKKYKCARAKNFRIVCVPNGQNSECLPWEKDAKAKSAKRGEVYPLTKQVQLYDIKFEDRLDCLTHEFFEVLLAELIQQYVDIHNGVEEILVRFIDEHNRLEKVLNALRSEQDDKTKRFMKDSYFEKEFLLNVFVENEKECRNKKVKKQ